MTISVVVAEDQPLVRAGLVLLLSSSPYVDVIGEAANGQQALDMGLTLRPDIVLMDIRMPGIDGIQATQMLTADPPAGDDHLTRVLVLTTFDEDDVVIGALRAGASGFLLKHAAPSDLITALTVVAKGQAWIDPAVAQTVLSVLSTTRPVTAHGTLERLTPREREILMLMAEGLDNSEIRELLVLSEATVKTHVSRILFKTGSRNRTEAVILAYQTRLVVPRADPRR